MKPFDSPPLRLLLKLALLVFFENPKLSPLPFDALPNPPNVPVPLNSFPELYALLVYQFPRSPTLSSPNPFPLLLPPYPKAGFCEGIYYPKISLDYPLVVSPPRTLGTPPPP